MAKLTSFLSTVLLILILLSVAPRLVKGIKEQYRCLVIPCTKVARVKIDTVIEDVDEYYEPLEQFFKDPQIKAVLLEIESPGGAAGSVQALYAEILRLKHEYRKPVVALTYNLCVSGSYYIAAAADYIIASPSAIVGSIGSYIDQFKLGELLSKYNVNYEIHKAGAYKSALNMFTAATPEQQQMLQALADSSYQQFIRDIALARKLSLTTADQWANGRLFTGNDALKSGLVDALGSLSTATQKIKELALIEREIEWVRQPVPSLFDRLLGKVHGSARPLFSLLAHVARDGVSSSACSAQPYAWY